MAYINNVLIKIYLLEKERGDSGRNGTMKITPSFTTNSNTETERDRGRGKREKREGENRSGYSVNVAVAFYNFALVKSKSETRLPFVHIMLTFNIGI